MDKFRFRSSSDFAWLAHRTLRGVDAVMPSGMFRRANDSVLADFRHAEKVQATARARIFFVLAMVVIGLSSLVDMVLGNQLPSLIFPVKSLTAIIMLALWVLTHNPNFVRGQAIALSTGLMALTLCWLACSVNHLNGLHALNEHYVLLVAVTLFGVLATAWRWTLQLFVVACLVLLAEGYWLRFESIPLAQLCLSSAILLCFAVLAVLFGYGYSSLRRQHFLQLHDLSMRSRGHKVIAGYRRLVAIDPLTGVANRHSLDRMLKQEWQRIRQQRGMISLLLLQVQQQNDLVNMVAPLLLLTQNSATCVARFDQHSLAVLWLDPQTVPTRSWLQHLQEVLAGETDNEKHRLMSLTCLQLETSCFLGDLYRRAVNGLQPIM